MFLLVECNNVDCTVTNETESVSPRNKPTPHHHQTQATPTHHQHQQTSSHNNHHSSSHQTSAQQSNNYHNTSQVRFISNILMVLLYIRIGVLPGIFPVLKSKKLLLCN